MKGKTLTRRNMGSYLVNITITLMVLMTSYTSYYSCSHIISIHVILYDFLFFGDIHQYKTK